VEPGHCLGLSRGAAISPQGDVHLGAGLARGRMAGWLGSSPIALAKDDVARLYVMDLGKNVRGSFAEQRQSDSWAGKRLRQQASGRQRERGHLASSSSQKRF